MKIYSFIWKILYGTLFIAVLPAALIIWAKMSEGNVPLPVVGSFAIGVALSFFGAVIMSSGIVALYLYGHGLPMSPYPPSRYVTEGIYRVIAHPIYTGFSILCVGVAIAAQSPSGLWLVSPVVIMSCAVWVLGFENHGLRKRFNGILTKPFIHLPEDKADAPDTAERISVYILVFLPWFILYEAVRVLGVPSDAIVAFFPFENDIPVYEWTEIFYISTYAFVLLTPLIAKTKHDLRKFSIDGLIATGVIIFLFLMIPLIAPSRPFTPHSFFGKLLVLERTYDTPAAAFPSFHVVWALLAASTYAKSVPSLKSLWWGWALIISASCITTGMHAAVDVMGGLIVFLIVIQMNKVWETIRKFSEFIANSWREWQFGPVRVINHGIYAGVGTFIGLSIVGILLGQEYVLSIALIALCSLIMAGLWAQFVEGSPRLLRPYGYYGGVVGVIIGSLMTQWFWAANIWWLLAAFSIVGPWIQSAGRLRCLVQGCCHGRETSRRIGIRYVHPRSRVHKLAGLGGMPIHPTPLYSILWNFVVGIVMIRLWYLNVQPPFIGGIYLILTGLGRFVEESYRGEPQTPVIGGLRFYQWLAIGSVLAGAALTSVGHTAGMPTPEFSLKSIVFAGFFGLCTWFALGVDFPGSNRRFSRLV